VLAPGLITAPDRIEQRKRRLWRKVAAKPLQYLHRPVWLAHEQQVPFVGPCPRKGLRKHLGGVGVGSVGIEHGKDLHAQRSEPSAPRFVLQDHGLHLVAPKQRPPAGLLVGNDGRRAAMPRLGKAIQGAGDARRIQPAVGVVREQNDRLRMRGPPAGVDRAERDQLLSAASAPRGRGRQLRKVWIRACDQADDARLSWRKLARKLGCGRKRGGNRCRLCARGTCLCCKHRKRDSPNEAKKATLAARKRGCGIELHAAYGSRGWGMITPEFFNDRWSWYRPILERGEEPAQRAVIEVQRLPLRVPGEDAREYIPFAAHPDLRKALAGSLARLAEFARRYLVEGKKVSAHTLPRMDAAARARVQLLRHWYPHLPLNLLHHWCADAQGAPSFVAAARAVWLQGWRQEEADRAPWVKATSILLLRLIREAAKGAMRDAPEIVEHAMLSVAGTVFAEEIRAFLREQLGGDVDPTRIASYEAMMLPATPIVFLAREIPDALLADDARLIRLYGLEPELLPRMRALRERLGWRNEGGMLNLLGRDRLGNHLLRRAWARLSIWDLAVRTKDGRWMQWVLDVKKLDRLLMRGEMPPDAMLAQLQAHADVPFAGWLLAYAKEKRRDAGEQGPWLTDERTLNAFRVFEEDVRIEITRRRSERCWLDRSEQIVGRLKGPEAIKRLEQAWKDGEIAWLQLAPAPLLGEARGALGTQGLLRVSWSAYLAKLTARLQDEAEEFLLQRFLPRVEETLKRKDVFLDAVDGSGCLARGAVQPLFFAACDLRTLLQELWQEGAQEGAPLPALPMALSLAEHWISAEREGRRLHLSSAVAEADALLAHDAGVAELATLRERKAGVFPGRVRIVRLSLGGAQVSLLHNEGLVLTAPFVMELIRAFEKRGKALNVHLDAARAKATLSGLWIEPEGLELVLLRRHNEEGFHLLRQAGKIACNGRKVQLFEWVNEETEGGRKLRSTVQGWIRG